MEFIWNNFKNIKTMIYAIIILLALVAGILYLLIKGWRDGKEPGPGYSVKYDYFDDERKRFDPEYLQECIEKATPNLSKIKDVDQALAEIRGDYPTEFEELTKDPGDEHAIIEKEIDDFLKVRELRRKLKKIEAERDVNKSLLG